MARRSTDFQTIRSEGGLLPPDLLRRVLDPKEKLEGTAPPDYGLPPGERLNEAITQSWNRLTKHWVEFRAAAQNLPEGEPGTGLTNDKWSVPLLRELSFGLLPATTAPEIGGKTYAINRFFGAAAIHLVGCGLSLDRRAAGVRGAAIANPHGLVQEFLNRSDTHLWAILSNGLQLRILRDSQAISRQSYLEFDLESMFDGEVFSDFVLLWLMAHATRFAAREGQRLESCWLEQWTKLAEEQGTRALGDLRGGVEKALEILGQGFVGHPKNTALRDALRTGSLSLADFHRQLLRVIYRLIFLFVAEDRTLDGVSVLHVLEGSEAARTARERYASHYSAGRLRDLAGHVRGSRHGDLWHQLNLVAGALSGDERFKAVRESLALPALGSFLWAADSSAALNAPSLADAGGTELANADLLDAIRNLAFTRPNGRSLRPVDYKNLGAEELGGVYESLLALTPQVSGDGAQFTFAEFAGNERKTSGSYYTPDSLVQCLLDSALDPVVEDAIKGKSSDAAEKSIFALKVCDPAVGSGHFLVGAAHRLARHLARVRAFAQGEGEPSPLFYQQALRDVIGHCLYGVDINPMAAELCRVSLWLEALEPGKPLSFLDHHIRVGNSLLGTTPELIAGGLPDDTFKAIEGDDKKTCTQLRKKNKAEREGFSQGDLLGGAETGLRPDLQAVTEQSRALDMAPDDTLEHLERKSQQFQDLTSSEPYAHAKLVADTWCAAFVWPKTPETVSEVPTTATVRDLEANADALTDPQRAEVDHLAVQYQFFHWHLAFPEVFDKGGFDCVLGNPPWENLQTDPQEFFATSAPAIAAAENMAERNRLIARLKQSDPQLFQLWIDRNREADAGRHFLKSSGRYPLSTYGRLNTYGIFAELGISAIRTKGRTGLIVPVGIATDAFNQYFFSDLIKRGRLVSLYGFENEEFVFPEVHHAFKFALMTVGTDGASATTELAFFLRSFSDLSSPELRYPLGRKDFELINPNTVTCPVFRTRRDALITAHVYRLWPVILRDEPSFNPWGVKCQLMFMGNTVSEQTLSREQLADQGIQVESRGDAPSDRYLPLFEGKMFHQFDHRFGTYDGQTEAQANQGKLPELTPEEHADPTLRVLPRYWLPTTVVSEALSEFSRSRWLLSWRDVTSTVVVRTAIAAVLPVCATNDSAPVVHMPERAAKEVGAFLGSLNSYAVDFVARQKLGGNHLRFFTFFQLPVIPPELFHQPPAWRQSAQTTLDWLLPRVLELTYTALDLEHFAEDCGFDGPPFRWDEERRFLLRCELDAAFFHLYLPSDAHGDLVKAESESEEDMERLRQSFPTPRDAIDYIMDTFPIVKQRDEERYGSYRTKETILAIYDEMQEAMRTGGEYRTRLEPPPGDKKCCHPPKGEAKH